MKRHCKHDLPPDCCLTCGSERNEAEYEDLARITGRSIEELDADLTAPDPKRKRSLEDFYNIEAEAPRSHGGRYIPSDAELAQWDEDKARWDDEGETRMAILDTIHPF